MALEKMIIKAETKKVGTLDKKIEVMFNPSQFAVTRAVPWPNVDSLGGKTQLQFTHTAPATLAIKFFFDVFEQNGDVTLKIKDIVALSEYVEELHRPPICQLHWGTWLFQGVLTNLRQDFTLFQECGTPVRVALTCAFTEHAMGKPAPPGETPPAKVEPRSPDVAKTYRLKPGDRLTGIADSQYNDPSLWRVIADANRIVDPLRPPVGQALLIPALTPETRSR
jgi:nucleoid-associated protein YgaU